MEDVPMRDVQDEILQLTGNRFLQTQQHYIGHHYKLTIPKDPLSFNSKLHAKITSEYAHVKDLSAPIQPTIGADSSVQNKPTTPVQTGNNNASSLVPNSTHLSASSTVPQSTQTSQSLVPFTGPKTTSGALTPIHRTPPEYHPPWQIMRVSFQKLHCFFSKIDIKENQTHVKN